MSKQLKVSQLTVEFQGVKAVDDVSFELNQNEIVAIVGESGSGKTTLLKAAAGLLPKEGKVTSGKVLVGDKNMTALKSPEHQRVMGSTIGVIFQNPSAYLNPIHRVSYQFVEYIRSHKAVSKKEALDIARVNLKKLDFVDVETVLHAHVNELSGGMQQRVYIAMVISLNPDIILADEPTSALDVCVSKTIADEILAIQSASEAGFLVVTHDIAFAAYIADRIIVMKDGKIVECDTTRKVVASPDHPYTISLLGAVRELEY